MIEKATRPSNAVGAAWIGSAGIVAFHVPGTSEVPGTF